MKGMDVYGFNSNWSQIVSLSFLSFVFLFFFSFRFFFSSLLSFLSLLSPTLSAAVSNALSHQLLNSSFLYPSYSSILSYSIHIILRCRLQRSTGSLVTHSQSISSNINTLYSFHPCLSKYFRANSISSVLTIVAPPAVILQGSSNLVRAA
jgi:hypothetical protein